MIRMARARRLGTGAALVLAIAGAIRAAPAEPAAPAPGPAKDVRDVLGVAHVAGTYHLTDGDFLGEGADQVLALGSRVLKLYLFQPARNYPFNTRWPEAATLAELAQSPPYAAVFRKPFTTYVLTVYALGRPEHYWRAGVSESEKADERRQFYELTKHLLAAWRGTGKTFVLQHWEGDWAVRGGFDPKTDPEPKAVQGMIDWLQARQEGVDLARAEVGERGVHVYHAAEVNLVVQSLRDGRPGVANRVLPQVRLDLVSYSAWDAQDDPKTLREALDFIASQAPPSRAFGNRNVYVGEFGKPENEFGPEKVRQTVRGAVRAALDWGCPYVIYWQVYCNEARRRPVRQNDDVRGFWLLRPDGTRAAAWDCLAEFLRPPPPAPAKAGG
jgi:hypothetical protein